MIRDNNQQDRIERTCFVIEKSNVWTHNSSVKHKRLKNACNKTIQRSVDFYWMSQA